MKIRFLNRHLETSYLEGEILETVKPDPESGIFVGYLVLKVQDQIFRIFDSTEVQRYADGTILGRTY